MVETGKSIFHEQCQQILLIRKNDLKTQYTLCSELLLKAQEASDHYALAFAHAYLADYYIAMKELEKCSYHAFCAEEIAKTHQYYDLLLRIYGICGIYFESLHDEQTALEYYLECIDIGSELNDREAMCRCYNNIASIFQFYCDYDEAKKYFLLAYDIIDNYYFEHRNHYVVTLLTNLCDICRMQEKYDDAQYYLDLIKPYCHENPLFDLFYKRNLIGLMIQQNDVESAIKIAEEIIQMDLEAVLDRFTIFELLSAICDSLIETKNAELIYHYIVALKAITKSTEVSSHLQIQNFRIQYYEMLGNKEKQYDAYKEYHEIQKRNQLISNNVKSNGMKAKLELRETLREKNLIEQKNHALENMISIDELTQLYNRRALNQLTNAALENTEVDTIGFIMIDVDYFKDYNDFYGHTKGDDVLKVLGRILDMYKTQSIYPCRFGGDEFTCVAINLSDDEIANYVENITKELKKKYIPHEKSRCSKYITISVGSCNEMREDIHDIKHLFDRADTALYHSKLYGRNNYTSYNNRI